MGITIPIDAVDKGAAQVIQALAAAEDKAVDKFKKLADESQKASKEWQKETDVTAQKLLQLNRSINRGVSAVRRNRDESEKLKNTLADLRSARKDGQISSEEYRTTIRRVVGAERDRRSEVDSSKQAIAQRTSVLKRANRTEGEFASIEGRVAGLLKRSETAQEQFNRDIEAAVVARRAQVITEREFNSVRSEARRRLEDYGKQEKETFGSKSLTRISSHFAAIASGAGAIQFVRTAIAYYKQELDDATGSTDTLSHSRQRLTQVATSSTDLAGLERRSDRIALDEGVDRVAARNFLFSARSENFEGEADALSKRFQNIQVETVATLAGQVRDLFGGELTSVETVEAAFAGAQASRSDIEDITRALSTVAEGGRRIGASGVEQIATLSVLSGLYKSPERAANRINALESRIDLRGREFGIDTDSGIAAAVNQISGLSGEDRKKFLGESQEVNAAFDDTLANLDAIAKRQVVVEDAVAKANTQNAVSLQARGFKFSNEATGDLNRAQLKARQAKIADEISAENALAKRGFETQATVSNVKRQLRDSGAGAVGGLVGEISADLNRTLGFDQTTAELVGVAAGSVAEKGGGQNFMQRLANRFVAVATERGVEEMNKNLRATNDALNNFTNAVQSNASPISGEPGKDR